MSKWNISLLIIVIFTIYFAFNCLQDKKTAQDKVIELTDKIVRLNTDIKKNNQIIVQREQEKAQAVIAIKQLNEQLQNVLENNQCANEFMPANVSDWMRSGKD